MKNKKTLLFNLATMILSGLILFSGCQPNEIILQQESSPYGEMMVLGKELENPYSVANMRKAYENLMANKRTTEDIEIATTHYYIRFLPSDTADIAVLNSDTTLELWDHPLLFEIEQIGNWYHDPSIPDSLPTWQYTVVKKRL